MFLKYHFINFQNFNLVVVQIHEKITYFFGIILVYTNLTEPATTFYGLNVSCTVCACTNMSTHD